MVAAVALLYMYGAGIVVISDRGVEISTLLLTASAVVLAAATLVIALLGVFGFREIRDKAIEAAKETATETATKIAGDVARDVAQSVSARTAVDATAGVRTTAEQADEIAGAIEAGKDDA